MRKQPTKCPLILLAEDDEDDQEFMALAFKKVPAAPAFHFAHNGQEALEYLFALPETELPCLIVLDLNMPVLNGVQTLEALKDEPKYRHIPKVIFTTSDRVEDKERCLSVGAADYLIKPSSMTDIVTTIEHLLHLCQSA